MSLPVHTVDQGKASTGFSQKDRVTLYNFAQMTYPAGNGDPTAIAAGTPGQGYASIPTVAYANKGAGASATAVANMGLVAVPTITAGGTGGTPGAVTLTGTDGTGTKYQVTGTINGSGVLSAVSAIGVAGVYTALPGTLTAGAVSGGSLSGATLNLTGCFGVVSYTTADGSSNHEYPQGTTAVLTGGTPTTAAVPGAVTVTSVAGQGALMTIGGLKLPAKFAVILGDLGQDATAYVSSRGVTGVTVAVNPRLASETLAAGDIDILITH